MGVDGVYDLCYRRLVTKNVGRTLVTYYFRSFDICNKQCICHCYVSSFGAISRLCNAFLIFVATVWLHQYENASLCRSILWWSICMLPPAVVATLVILEWRLSSFLFLFQWICHGYLWIQTRRLRYWQALLSFDLCRSQLYSWFFLIPSWFHQLERWYCFVRIFVAYPVRICIEYVWW